LETGPNESTLVLRFKELRKNLNWRNAGAKIEYPEDEIKPIAIELDRANCWIKLSFRYSDARPADVKFITEDVNGKQVTVLIRLKYK